MSIPEPAVRLVTTCFGAATTRAAMALATADRVHLVRPLWPVVARVRDDESHVVTVHYDAGAIHLRGDCSCRVAVDCAHAAATALVALAQQASNDSARARAASEASVGEWLTGLGLVERDRSEPPAADRIVAYVLEMRDGIVGLTPLAATRMRRGGLGAGQPIAALADPMRGAPRWVDVADLRRIAMLRAVSRAPADTSRLRIDRLHGELLRELADAGVLFWESTRGDPLRWGAPLTDTLRWCAAGDDLYRLALDTELVILPARECHYVDAANATLGPLELGLSAELVDKLIHGPAVPSSMRATVDRSLRPLLGDSRSPDDVEPMRPHLHAWIDHEDPALRHAVQLRCDAVYGDEHVPLAIWDAARSLARDLVAEGRARARLDALLDRLPYGDRAATSMELLADARHVAHVIIPALRAEGWECSLADDYPHEAPVANVSFIERLQPRPESHGWFTVELGVTVGGRTVPLLPILLQAIRDGHLVIAPGGVTVAGGGGLNLTLPEGELIHVPADRVARWLRPLVELELHGLDEDGALVVPPAAALAIDDDAPRRFAASDVLDAARAQLESLNALVPREAGAEFVGALRPYQALGHAWLRALHDAACGGLLADEMGLGKTVQVLAFLDGLRADGVLTAAAPALVVAPRSVVGNWQAEAARFAPKIASQVHLGTERPDVPADVMRTPLVITSYQTLTRDIDLLRSIRWTTVIFDEAQQVKNPDTQLRAAAAALEADSRFTITGTPIENHLGDLWSQMDLAVPGLLGRRASFDALVRRPVEKFAATVPLEHLRQTIRPFLLRRTKEQVELDLPPKTEIIERIDLDPAQRDLYESLRLTLDTQVRAALARKGIQGASMTILDALLKLRQCCCDPRLVPLEQARKVRTSAKLDRLLAMLEELTDAGRSTLVFSQFATMLGLIQKSCERAGLTTLSLTGATRDRDAVVRRFQAGEAPVLLVSLKAGGVGLNLTRADTVIHYDPWWNPAVEAQATDRAHRIGQDRHVHVYKLVARGTLEDTILQLQDEKRALTVHALYERI